jgi:hypothetical protein
MSGRHSFEATATTDARGALTVAWATIPGRTSVRQAYAWSGGRTQQLTSGPRSAAFVALDVAPDGAAAVSVAKGEEVFVARRGAPGAFGPAVAVPGVAGLARVATAGGAFAVTGRPSGDPDSGVVIAAARRLADPFGPPVRTAPPTAPPGTTNLIRPAAVGFTPDGAVVVAYSALHQEIGPVEQRTLGASVYAAVWPRDAAEPLPPVELSRAPFAFDPAFVSDAGRGWFAWLEGHGACCQADAVVAAPLVAGGVGPSVARGMPGPPSLGFDPPAVAAARGGGVRFYVPGASRRSAALHTVRLAPDGTFGTPEKVAGGRALAPANFLIRPVAARGRAADAVGWSSPAGGTESPDSRVRIARR